MASGQVLWPSLRRLPLEAGVPECPTRPLIVGHLTVKQALACCSSILACSSLTPRHLNCCHAEPLQAGQATMDRGVLFIAQRSIFGQLTLVSGAAQATRRSALSRVPLSRSQYRPASRAERGSQLHQSHSHAAAAAPLLAVLSQPTERSSTRTECS